MRFLIVFATTEGHTRNLATFASDRLRRVGHQVHICDAAQSDMADFARFEAALLIASVHLGRYQASLTKFARTNHVALNAIPSAFVSVSLSAAGADPSYPGLRDCVERLERDTFWRPGVVHHAAGAMPFSAYGFFTKFAIKLIARRHGMLVKSSQDYDLTDYAALEAFIDRFLASAIGTDCPPMSIRSASRLRR
jgi:menaquinone-dependent protoporphyrinogen oxidase